MIKKKCLEHRSMLPVLQDPNNGAAALKHLKQQVRAIVKHILPIEINF